MSFLDRLFRRPEIDDTVKLPGIVAAAASRDGSSDAEARMESAKRIGERTLRVANQVNERVERNIINWDTLIPEKERE